MDVKSFVVCIPGKMEQDVGWYESIVVSFLSYLVGFLVPFLQVIFLFSELSSDLLIFLIP